MARGFSETRTWSSRTSARDATRPFRPMTRTVRRGFARSRMPRWRDVQQSHLAQASLDGSLRHISIIFALPSPLISGPRFNFTSECDTLWYTRHRFRNIIFYSLYKAGSYRRTTGQLAHLIKSIFSWREPSWSTMRISGSPASGLDTWRLFFCSRVMHDASSLLGAQSAPCCSSVV